MKTKEIPENPDVASAQPEALPFAGLSSIAQEELAEGAEASQAQEQAAEKDAAAEKESNAEGWRKAVDHAGDMICAMLPEASPVWSGDRKQNLAEALARCDEAYGWGGVGGLVGHPLVALGFASFPLVVGTARAMKEARAKAVIDVSANEVKPNQKQPDPMGVALDQASGPAPAAS